MLRAALIGLGALLLAGAGLAAALGGGPPAWGLGAFGALLLAGTLFERRRYDAIADRPPGAGWEPTGERFRDPASGVEVEVWFNPATGRRQYVRSNAAAT
ncbi:MAG TPA: hypothetical protein VNE67_05135 [Acetobacteraceae bacterium]|nr:hypothetical protein [Acetobacteraceae bacterium]